MIRRFLLKNKVIKLTILGIIISLFFSFIKPVQSQLPELKPHPLPSYLSNFSPDNNDYFSEIKTTPVGYLIWTHFPLKFYLDQPRETNENIASVKRFLQWRKIIKKGISEWHEYLPMIEVEQEEKADIIIKRNVPPWTPKINPETGLFDFPTISIAQTNYKFYLSEDNPPLLLHKMTILVSPNLADDSILSAIRHELGHAFGIWGHSKNPQDALFFAQVKETPPISQRDINTLIKIYQQPTKLGWPINNY